MNLIKNNKYYIATDQSSNECDKSVVIVYKIENGITYIIDCASISSKSKKETFIEYCKRFNNMVNKLKEKYFYNKNTYYE